MTASHEKLPYLRLVESEKPHDHTALTTTTTRFGAQISLFSDASSETLGFIEVSKMRASTFQRLLEDVQPRLIFDLRLIPNFGDGNLTRRTIFALFESYGIRYFDVAGAIGARSPRDASLNPRLLVPNILQNILKTDRSLTGPVLFFLDSEQFSETFIAGIESELPHQNARGWEVSVWEGQHQIAPSTEGRRLVFISHANPEDNEVALWFATRLAAEGYDVWSDVTRLIGGEFFWDSIEDIIRNKAACVVVLLSKEGHEKPGVLDEVNLAVATERRIGAKNFVVPVRIDDLSFSSIRANIARRNVIDASDGLSPAFRSVIEALEQIEVPRRRGDDASAIQAWREALPPYEKKWEQNQWDLLTENRIEIVNWPRTLRRFCSVGRPYVYRAGLADVHLAIAPAGRGSFTFADAQEIAEVLNVSSLPAPSGEATVDSILDDSLSDVFECHQRQVLNALAAIVRQGWDFACKRRGLKEFRLANNRICWFPSVGFAHNNEVRYIDHSGKTRRRILVGRSNAKRVYWHFGVEASIAVQAKTIRMKPHVVFTEDGRTPIASVSKQHALRRSFCRNWWNDRWRDLLEAMLQYLSCGEDHWQLPVSSKHSILVSGQLVRYSVGVDEHERLSSLAEPNVAVGMDQEADDPKEGLMLFGPVPFERNPTEIRVGVVGTAEGLELFESWCTSFRKPVSISKEMRKDGSVPFPGFEAVFKAAWPARAAVAQLISRTDLLNVIRIRDRYQAVYAAVDLFVEQIRKVTIDDDAQVDIWYIVIPDEVYLYGRPNSRVPKAISLAPISRLNKRIATRFAGNAPSLFPEDNEDARIYEHHADFHHQLKARLLKLKAVTQIIRESSIIQTLDPDVSVQEEDDFDSEPEENVTGTSYTRRMQDPLNVSWNLATASFFKAGGRPWRVATARPGVCYVGLIFKRNEIKGLGHACCGAQLFLDSGEGLVFKGTMGPWYSKKTKQFHLSKEEAKRLMEKALEAYKDIHHMYPRELFVHGRTRFSSDELEGFADAASSNTEITGVRITRTSDFKLFSAGSLPVKRGTMLKLNDRVGLIWTSGFVERLNTYQGRETPNPLRVEICGKANVDLHTVMQDIMTLTKMNFNSCVYADGYPVTMRFADAIGDVLMATGNRELPPLPFRHYI